MGAAAAVSLVALVSFVFGAVLVLLLLWSLWLYVTSKPGRIGQVLSGMVVAMGNRGMPDLMVRTIDGSWARVTTPDLAEALQRVDPFDDAEREPPEGGLGC